MAGHRKILLVQVLSFLMLLVLVSVTCTYFLRQSSQQRDTQRLEQGISHVATSLKNETSSLHSASEIWANSGAAWNFMRGTNSGFEEFDLNQNKDVLSMLGVTSMIFFDNNFNVRLTKNFGVPADPGAAKRDFQYLIRDNLGNQAALNNLTSSGISAIANSGGTAVIMSIRPIINSAVSGGARQGFMLMTKEISSGVTSKLSDSLGIKFVLSQVADSDKKEALSGTVSIDSRSRKGWIVGRKAVMNNDDQPVFWINTSLKRDTFPAAERVLNYVLLVFAAIVLAMYFRSARIAEQAYAAEVSNAIKEMQEKKGARITGAQPEQKVVATAWNTAEAKRPEPVKVAAVVDSTPQKLEERHDRPTPGAVPKEVKTVAAPPQKAAEHNCSCAENNCSCKEKPARSNVFEDGRIATLPQKAIEHTCSCIECPKGYDESEFDGLKSDIYEKFTHDCNRLCYRTLEEIAITFTPRDESFCRNIVRMARKACDFARRMNLPEDENIFVYYSALFSRLGLIAIPFSARKPKWELSEEDLKEYRKYPEMSRTLMESIEILRSSTTIPYCWKENWDGTGFPQRLKGEDIPIEARLFAVVNEWNELTRMWQGRKLITQQEIEARMRARGGTRLDPFLVEEFIKFLEEDKNADSGPLRNLGCTKLSVKAKNMMTPLRMRMEPRRIVTAGAAKAKTRAGGMIGTAGSSSTGGQAAAKGAGIGMPQRKPLRASGKKAVRVMTRTSWKKK